MATHINRKQLLHASDEDILEFSHRLSFMVYFLQRLKAFKKQTIIKDTFPILHWMGTLQIFALPF